MIVFRLSSPFRDRPLCQWSLALMCALAILVGCNVGFALEALPVPASPETVIPPYPRPSPQLPPPYVSQQPSVPTRPLLNLPPVKLQETVEPMTDSRTVDDNPGSAVNNNPVRLELEDEEQEKQRRIERLRQQIEELRRIPAEPPAQPTSPESPDELPDSSPSTVEVLPPDPSKSEMPSTTPVDITPGPSVRSGDSPRLPTNPGQIVVEGPVDRLGLADSLFATGQITLALEMYSQLEAASYPSDVQVWIEFQQASCHRRLDNLLEAEKRYRVVIASTPPEWLGNLSRWWLNAIAERKRLTGEAARLDEIFSEIGDELVQELKGSSHAR